MRGRLSNLADHHTHTKSLPPRLSFPASRPDEKGQIQPITWIGTNNQMFSTLMEKTSG
jgi:hypothetical protein